MQEISLREVIEIIIKGKKIIAVTLVVFLLLGMGATAFINWRSGTAKVLLEMSFEGVDKGLNPDGTKFDVNIVKSPIVIQSALDSLGGDYSKISAESVRNNMDVQDIVPKSITDKATKFAKDGKDFVYYPNQFLVTLNANESYGLGKSQSVKVLDAIVSSYETYFNDLYSDKAILANAVGNLDYSEYDYPEISQVLNNQISIMKNYLETKRKDSPDFRSQKTGLSFIDLSGMLDVIDTVDVKRMDSQIGAYNLTKDMEKLILNYEYKIKMNELDKAKKDSESVIAKDMMNNFKQEKNSILIPGLNTGTDEEQEKVKLEGDVSYYDKLAEKSTTAGVEAMNKVHDNEYLKNEIQKLKDDTVTAEVKKSAEKDVLAQLDSVKKKLQNWIEKTNETVKDYYDVKYTQSIIRLAPVEVSVKFDMKMNLAVSLALGLVLSMLAVFLMDYWKKSKVMEPRPIEVTE